MSKKKKRKRRSNNESSKEEENDTREFSPLTTQKLMENSSKESCRCNEGWVRAYVISVVMYVLPVLFVMPLVLQNAVTATSSSYGALMFVSLFFAHVFLLVIGNVCVRAFVNHSIERYFRQKFHFIAEELRLSLLRNSDNKAKLAKIHKDAASFLIEREQERLQRKSMSFETSSKGFAAVVFVALVIMFAAVPNIFGEGSDIEISPSVLGVLSLIVLVVLPLSLFTYVNIRHPPSLTEKLPVEEFDRYNTGIYKRFVPILRSRFVAITILGFGALLVVLPFLSGLPVSLTLLTSAEKSDWTVSLSRRVFRVVVSLALTVCCVLTSMFVWSKPRRLPREMRKRSRRTLVYHPLAYHSRIT